MATLIRADGTESEVHPRAGTFTLQELYEHVGCSLVEHVGLADGRDMWVDEEGKLDRKPVNEAATVLLHQAGGQLHDVVVGDVLITTDVEVD